MSASDYPYHKVSLQDFFMIKVWFSDLILGIVPGYESNVVREKTKSKKDL